MDMNNFIELGQPVRFDPVEFARFVRQRRSMRRFTDKPVPRRDLEALVDLCRYVPTGSNRQTFEIMVIQDRDKLDRYSNHVVDHFEQTIPVIEQEVAETRAAGREVDQITLSMLNMVDGLKRVVTARTYGLEVIFHQAPAALVFHSPQFTSTPKDDCVIAAQTLVLAAMNMGLETCYIGLFEFAANTYPPLVEELALPPNHKVYSTLVMGYPEFKYLRTVDRKPMRVRWE
jgi:nitroreductase